MLPTKRFNETWMFFQTKGIQSSSKHFFVNNKKIKDKEVQLNEAMIFY